jgi:hypothetical protein
MLLALLFAAMLIFGAKTGGALVAGSFMFCGAFICGCVAFDGLAVLLNKASPEDKAARLGLESLEAALSSGRPWQTPGLGPAPVDQPPDIPLDLPPGLGVSRVDHAVVHEQFIRRPTLRGGSLTLKYLIYDFMVDGEPVSWPVGDKTSNLAEMPAFRRAHPPFLAPGDMVLTLTRGRLGLVVRANMPTISHKPVLELFNLTDRSACPSETDFKGALPYLYLGALVTILSVPVMVAEVAFFSSSREGLGAVLEALHSLVDFLPNGFLAMGGLVLIVEAAIATNNDPEMVAGRRNWRLLASSLKRRTALARLCGVFWERFSPWRIWITLAVTLVSFLLTYQS